MSGGDGVAAQMWRVFVICGAVWSGRSVWLGVVNAALARVEPWPAEERADGRTAFRGGELGLHDRITESARGLQIFRGIDACWDSSRLGLRYELRRYSMSLPAASDVQSAAPGIYPTTCPEAVIK